MFAATHIALWDNNVFKLKLSETLQTPLVRVLQAVLVHVFMVWDLTLSTGQSVLVIFFFSLDYLLPVFKNNK